MSERRRKRRLEEKDGKEEEEIEQEEEAIWGSFLWDTSSRVGLVLSRSFPTFLFIFSTVYSLSASFFTPGESGFPKKINNSINRDI